MRSTQIKVEMARQGLTGAALARDLGYSVQAGYVNKIARGTMTCSTAAAIKIALALKVPMVRLFDSGGGMHRAKAANLKNGVSGVAD